MIIVIIKFVIYTKTLNNMPDKRLEDLKDLIHEIKHLNFMQAIAWLKTERKKSEMEGNPDERNLKKIKFIHLLDVLYAGIPPKSYYNEQEIKKYLIPLFKKYVAHDEDKHGYFSSWIDLYER
jgi:hypothetical protein